MHVSDTPIPETDAPGLSPSERSRQRISEILGETEESLESIKTPEDVEGVVWQVMEGRPDVQEFDDVIASGVGGLREEKARHAKRSVFEYLKLEVALICGVELDELVHEQQRNEYRAKIKDTVKDLPTDSSAEDVLLTLGMLKPATDSSKHVFVFPAELFPPYIEEQWGKYTDWVKKYSAAQKQFQEGILESKDDIARFELVRKHAHNTVALSIRDFLGFPDWGLKEYRHLVDKMLENRFPTLETNELETTAAAAREFIRETLILSHGWHHRQDPAE